MSGRRGLRLSGVLLLGVGAGGIGIGGCTPAADAPVPASSPPDPVPVIDAASAPGSEPTSPTPVGSEPVPQEINARYAEQTDPNHWVARFEREGREVFDHRVQILDTLAPKPGQAVADVGAGTGLLTLELAQRVGAEGKVYAVDVQAYFLEHIAQKAGEAGVSNVETVLAGQDSAALPGGSVDAVLMCDSFHHVEKPGPYLRSLHQALRPGGRLWIVDYIAVEGQSEEWVLGHVRATPDQFRAEIEQAGFNFVQEHAGILEENFFFEFERP